MKPPLKLLLILLLIFGLERFCRSQTDGFRLEKTVGDLPPQKQWEVEGNEAFAQELLAQPYTFLGSGVQSYVFLSADGRHVLKFFKHYHTGFPTPLFKQLPLPFCFERWRQKTLLARSKRMHSILNSSYLAYSCLKEDTGVVYLHLNPGGSYPLLTLYDKIGIRHEIDLSSRPFLLQKRADLVFPTLSALLKKGDLEGAKAHVDSLLNCIICRCQKNIVSSDPIIRRNFGFLEGKALEIDTGSFSQTPFLKNPALLKKELYFETLELKEWLEKHCPALAQHLEEKIL